MSSLVAPRLPARTRVAAGLGAGVAGLSRRLGRGSGSVVGGRAILAVDAAALRRLAEGRQVALVSGTNGKTTTTSLLRAALAATGPVASNVTGANLLPGLTAALAWSRGAPRAALEVDEAWLARAAADTAPVVVALLNLSRDQLDRNNEVRMLAATWRRMCAGGGAGVVVANADDPLVTWAASAAPVVRWVGAGQPWTADAAGCPACGGRIDFGAAASAAQNAAASAVQNAAASAAQNAAASAARNAPAPAAQHTPAQAPQYTPAPVGQHALASAPENAPASAPQRGGNSTEGWFCTGCALARPPLDVRVEGDAVVVADGGTWPLRLALPGRANRADAAMALMSAVELGSDPMTALEGMRTVDEVMGRYKRARTGGFEARLLLAKNPAGWLEVLDVLRPPPRPVVVAINARIADGRDPSWLWDVPFERLAGRMVVATGERSRDLAVRLRYADVERVRIDDPVAAIHEAGRAAGDRSVDVVGNYTAFQVIRQRLAA